MKVFKFGGASVKDALGVKNVAKVLNLQKFENGVIVVSAMGKTTNALEAVVEAYFNGSDYLSGLSKIEDFHYQIVRDLDLEDIAEAKGIFSVFNDIQSFLERNKSPNYNFVYDQIVSCGEILSSKILSCYLNKNDIANSWLDARDYIKTDDSYRDANVDWQRTEENIIALKPHKRYVTQGFIGSDANHFSVTLGREGSDYSAAIFAYALEVSQMVIWKDVPGVMTGDPRVFDNVKLLSNISYEEAIEMAYYGASVIHPKTLQPLKQKHIPLYVKSFTEPTAEGTMVGISDKNQKEESFILKKNQVLMKISTRDFSFIAEEHISLIFGLLYKYRMKVSLMQNSAISLAVCMEDKFDNYKKIIEDLECKFKIDCQKDISLYTIRNADMEKIDDFYEDKDILLEQISQKTIQIVTR
ncbi:aspartate kinase [Riemerella columbipharyngis]|uniref:Aspartokinase n=1 Tax=Riemerella columbipharyngis TaxID=1071918 RepID=A0A1G6YGJ8_9FLAO|nr:aspartate kinase [Riemerella columbipharyngis]SDD89123.1 aspartate kinase [Riemerella columbipharyngis]